MPFVLCKPLVLASASPRRRELLAQVGIHPEILPADGLDGFVEPNPNPGEPPRDYVLRTAMAKAQAVSAHRPGDVVLAADTVVVLIEPDEPVVQGGPDDQWAPVILGKPENIPAALHMLRRLNGRSHHVLTACCLLGVDSPETFCLDTEVEFLHWPDSALTAYAHTGEGLDKAGAYAIQGQGAFLCAEIRGSWGTVVGLPLGQVLERLYANKVIRPTSVVSIVK